VVDIERGGDSAIFPNDDEDDGESEVFTTPHADTSLSALLNHASRDPLTLRQALQSPDSDSWQAACEQELHMLEKLGVWTLVDPPQGHNIVANKWVFKQKADGHFKARLVTKGFTQKHGVDYNETFSPVARFESLRILFAIAALENWEIHSMDVKSAFLNGDLEEEIYMEQPSGFASPGQEHKVCRLHKSLYGLKQASRQWNAKIHDVLETLHFR